MADKAIADLQEVDNIYGNDYFLLEQDSTAKKLTGQKLINWLTAAADGHGGIRSIQKTKTSGLNDTYTITFADTNTFQYTVKNGDTYRVFIRYKASENATSMSTNPNAYIGICTTNATSAPSTMSSYTWYQFKGEQGVKGDIGTAAKMTSHSVTYQTSTNGTTPPTGAWSASIPAVPQGGYLWTKNTETWNSGDSTSVYGVTRFGMDGSGSVVSVNGESPDNSGNVTLTPANIGAATSSDVATAKSQAIDSAKTYTNGTYILVSENITLDKDNWSDADDDDDTNVAPYTMQVAVTGIKATDTPHITVKYGDDNDTNIKLQEAWSCVNRAEALAGSIKFTCFEDKPSENIPIQIEINRGTH